MTRAEDLFGRAVDAGIIDAPDDHDHERPAELEAGAHLELGDELRSRFGKRRNFLNMAAGVPVLGVTGINGAGKTLAAAESVAAQLAAGREVYSTVPVRGPFGETQPIKSLRHILELRNCTLFLDEAAVIFSSRSTASLPAEVVVRLQTLRHDDVTVIWTAPAWMRVDNLLREVTQGLLNVVPMLRVTDRDNPWPRPRLLGLGLMDTSQGKTDAEPTRRLRTRFARPVRLHAWGAYDTHADTPLLGRRHVGGRCVDCGGSVEVPKHSRARHEQLGIPWYEGDAFVRLAEMTAAQGRLPRFQEVGGA